MKAMRRALLVALGATLLPLPARAQKHRLGFLFTGSSWTLKRLRASVIAGLADRGYQADLNYELHERYAEGHADRLPALAGELLKMPVELLLTQGTPATVAAKQASATVPIVFITSGDPVVAGNVTGLSLLGGDAAVKQMELLRELVPGVKRIGLLASRAYPQDKLAFEEMERAARGTGTAVIFVETTPTPDYGGVFRAAVREKVDGLIVAASNLDSPDWANIPRLAASRKLPAVYGFSQAVGADGLASCEINRQEFFRSAGLYVEKILKGARPAELPVMQPTRLEVVLNVRAAQKLGIEVSDALRSRADRVID